MLLWLRQGVPFVHCSTHRLRGGEPLVGSFESVHSKVWIVVGTVGIVVALDRALDFGIVSSGIIGMEQYVFC